ncbi:single-stranded DNA-binding protein [Helicobacter sp. MIT 14-3879]|uniref:single-stranded DNA-binding protein n=1 Tax=Helicobacter sp. MIT 14-3879 TaxID=2040649 RepID=UPI000E1E5B8F|nr:single-stranded DNA-binding protein [Helicobacter sp. MIT 14-3879]RDU61408.1 single-stranded DNA-binding protein [Helicobacter sp. MIT 14-3879]
MFNKVIILGNLTRDVELRYLNTGTAIATIGLASNRKYKKQDGTPNEEVCFIDVTLFGRSAEVANQYLKRGSKILIEGRLHYEAWQDSQGNKRSKHTVIAENMQMLDSKPQGQYATPQGDWAQDYAGGYGNQTHNTYGQPANPYYPNQIHGNPTSTAQHVIPNTQTSNTYLEGQNIHSTSNNGNTQSYSQDLPEINVDSDEEIPF